mmetsp:Transcript_7073/g.7716  ORF Transcript_7073/g.7716 Transcript_7073/m.7716 type:complete len:145 (-) Transcript_7073:370-804(-)
MIPVLPAMNASSTFPRRGQSLFFNLYNRTKVSKIPFSNEYPKKKFHSASLYIENTQFVSATENRLSTCWKTSNTSIFNNLTTSIPNQLTSLLSDLSKWFIKRTYQPSIIRKRRKTGFLTRQKTVGGRRVLARRRNKGRTRLGGC